jgi:hypothetical protein
VNPKTFTIVFAMIHQGIITQSYADSGLIHFSLLETIQGSVEDWTCDKIGMVNTIVAGIDYDSDIS